MTSGLKLLRLAMSGYVVLPQLASVLMPTAVLPQGSLGTMCFVLLIFGLIFIISF